MEQILDSLYYKRDEIKNLITKIRQYEILQGVNGIGTMGVSIVRTSRSGSEDRIKVSFEEAWKISSILLKDSKDRLRVLLDEELKLVDSLIVRKRVL